MCFNIGVIIGPILGGILSDPAGTYPSVFGNIDFLVKFPYAMPNIVSALFMLSATVVTWLFLEEVSTSSPKNSTFQPAHLPRRPSTPEQICPITALCSARNSQAGSNVAGIPALLTNPCIQETSAQALPVSTSKCLRSHREILWKNGLDKTQARQPARESGHDIPSDYPSGASSSPMLS